MATRHDASAEHDANLRRVAKREVATGSSSTHGGVRGADAQQWVASGKTHGERTTTALPPPEPTWPNGRQVGQEAARNRRPGQPLA